MSRYFLLVFLSIIFIGGVYALSEDINQCKRECSSGKSGAIKECTNEFKSCKASCMQENKNCLNEVRSDLKECKSRCSDGNCIKLCNDISKNETKMCSKKECDLECTSDKKVCLEYAGFEYSNCPKACDLGLKNVSCLGNYSAGQVFEQGCDLCVCSFSGEILCKKTKYCNFDTANVNKQSCLNSGGLFQGLCTGPYFDIVCTSKNYCLCSGNSEYSCPDNYSCVTDFNIPVRRGTIEGWKDMLGRDLGNIGICATNN